MSDTQILHFFGGKGGSGKTTLALAFAQNLSEKLPKEKVLLVSLDASHALSDVLKKKMGAKPAKLQAGKGLGGLFAAELEPLEVAGPFIAELKDAVQKTAVKGAVLSDEELAAVLQQHAAGLEELASLLQVADELETKAYDRVVVDLSPTSHALRLFDLPTQLRRFVALARGQALDNKVKAKKEAVPPGPLDPVAARAEKLVALLKDPARTAFHLVALAEPVPEAQMRLLFAQLRERGIPMSEVVVNQVEDGQGCPACQGRRGLQAPHVRKYQQLDKAVPVALLAKREVAPRGPELVKKLAKEWAAGKETKQLEFAAAEGPPALVRAPSMPPIAAPPLPPTRLIFFVGQGGVGKSSCAAAAAVTLTEKEGPVLLISTDSAHSLSDVLQSRLTDTETQVKGTKGLYAREIDFATWFGNLRKRFRDRAEGAFGPEVKGQEFALDRELVRNLFETAPVGMDEFAAMSALTDALVQERFKRIVIDPAPSGDSLRILELPAIAKEW